MPDVRDRIEGLAKRKGLTITDIERLLGFGTGTIIKWNKSSPSMNKLLLVSDYLEVSLDYLVRGHDFIPNGPATEGEYDLIEYYRRLNDAGRDSLLEYMRFLVGQEKYIYAVKAQDH